MKYVPQKFRISFFVYLVLLIAPPSFTQYAANHSSVKDEMIVAQVGSIKITAEEFKLSYEFGPAFIKKLSDSKEKHLKYMINEKLLALDGNSRSIDSNKNVRDNIKAFSADIVTEEMFKDRILSRINNTDAEIDSVVTEKQIDVSLRWLYAESDSIIISYLAELKSGRSFDSLFQTQLKDAVKIEDRSMHSSRYTIGRKNPVLASIIDTMKVKTYSAPIHVNDGWYILFLDNLYQNTLISESEYIKLRDESNRAVTKRKMDNLSDRYVDSLMRRNNPIIKNSTFRVLRSYIGRYFLGKELYNNWELEKILQSTLSELNDNDPKKVSALELVKLADDEIMISDFLEWYWLRDRYIKLNKTSLQLFSQSLESIVWRMVRDELLTREAYANGYNNSNEAKKQISWWKDKIVSSAVKNEIKKTLLLENSEIKTPPNNRDMFANLEIEYKKKMFSKLNYLNKKYDVNIDHKILNGITVLEENNKKAIDFYTVKKGGLIPRTPYPTIDNDWASWE